jgi:hypothetical protein
VLVGGAVRDHVGQLPAAGYAQFPVDLTEMRIL